MIFIESIEQRTLRYRNLDSWYILFLVRRILTDSSGQNELPHGCDVLVKPPFLRAYCHMLNLPFICTHTVLELIRRNSVSLHRAQLRNCVKQTLNSSMQLSVSKLLLLLVLSEQDVLSSFLQILVYTKILLQSIEIMLEVFNVTGITIGSQIIRLRDKFETKLLRYD